MQGGNNKPILRLQRFYVDKLFKMEGNNIIKYIFLLILAQNRHTEGHYNYTFYCYEVSAFNEVEKSQLYNMYKEEQEVYFINDVTNGPDLPTKVIVRADMAVSFETFLYKTSIQYKYVGDLYKQKPINAKKGNISDSFYDWPDILLWMKQILQNHTDLLTKDVIAKTYEGREVIMLKVSVNNRNNPVVFIVGGEDGMDWISSSIILNFLDSLLKKKEEIMGLLRSFNFYIVPVLNPDGFVYSKETCWLWKKNRSIHKKSCFNGSNFIGVNIAKNWFFKEDIKDLKIVYPLNMGCTPISENETRGLAVALDNVALNMIAFINLYGYGNCITIPYAYSNYQSNNYHIVKEILEATRRTLQTLYNTDYLVGQTQRLFYNRFGTVADWVKMRLNTPIVYTVHMHDERTFLQDPKHLTSLTDHFITTLRESLPIAKLFYGPLFNKSLQLQNYFFLYASINFIWHKFIN